MSGLIAADGSLNVTVVDGITYTGIYAADGSINVILAPGTKYVGAYHPCGAWWVTVAPLSPTFPVPYRAPDGSLYVVKAISGFNPLTGIGLGTPVTVIAGSLTSGGALIPLLVF